MSEKSRFNAAILTMDGLRLHYAINLALLGGVCAYPEEVWYEQLNFALRRLVDAYEKAGYAWADCYVQLNRVHESPISSFGLHGPSYYDVLKTLSCSALEGVFAILCTDLSEGTRGLWDRPVELHLLRSSRVDPSNVSAVREAFLGKRAISKESVITLEEWSWFESALEQEYARAVSIIDERRRDRIARHASSWLGRDLEETKNAEPDKSKSSCGVFVPNDLQQAVLEVLKGRAMKKEALAHACKVDPRRLYKAGGLWELRNAELVEHKPGVGFFRPDFPPPNAIELGLALEGPLPGT